MSESGFSVGSLSRWLFTRLRDSLSRSLSSRLRDSLSRSLSSRLRDSLSRSLSSRLIGLNGLHGMYGSSMRIFYGNSRAWNLYRTGFAIGFLSRSLFAPYPVA